MVRNWLLDPEKEEFKTLLGMKRWEMNCHHCTVYSVFVPHTKCRKRIAALQISRGFSRTRLDLFSSIITSPLPRKQLSPPPIDNRNTLSLPLIFVNLICKSLLFSCALSSLLFMMIHQLAPVIERLVLPFLDDQNAVALEVFLIATPSHSSVLHLILCASTNPLPLRTTLPISSPFGAHCNHGPPQPQQLALGQQRRLRMDTRVVQDQPCQHGRSHRGRCHGQDLERAIYGW